MKQQEIHEQLKQKLPAEQIKVNEPMQKHTSFKIGGPADFYVSIHSVEELKKVIEYANGNQLQLTILGNGTNILVKDNGIRGIVIKNAIDKIEIQKQERNANVIVGAGVPLAKLAQLLAKQEIAGFEFACGIPGSMGGAIHMNAGAYGGEMKDIVKTVTYLDENNTVQTIKNEQCDFSYRHSFFTNHKGIIAEVVLELPYGNVEEIVAKMNEYLESRKTKQPIQFPSAGSTFKRGNDFITAKLIDECGLKGYQIGDAQISELHAGFVINKGKATAKDVIDLVEYVKKVVYEKTKNKIELEVEILGE